MGKFELMLMILKELSEVPSDKVHDLINETKQEIEATDKEASERLEGILNLCEEITISERKKALC